ncbi:MAG TPA: BTAD domain-containing putative transcriptional regulator [Candidatus Dormibacteraeota bacterium]
MDERAPLGAGGLALLGGFALHLGDRPLILPRGSQRLLALLALHERPLQRGYVAGVLWVDHGEQRSIANLRTALARLPRASPRLVDVMGRQLRLSDRVSVDVREVSTLMRRVIDRDESVIRIRGIHRRLMVDILPDWYDDWVVAEREPYRELRLHALETLCHALTAASDYMAAIEAGLAAVAAEPLRETAQGALIRAHLAEGNRAAAVLQYRRFSALLDRELGLAPPSSLTTLIHRCMHEDGLRHG